MSNENKNRYICNLPTNGYAAGQEAFLTDAEVANFNGGEEIPRFVLAGEASAADAPTEEKATEATPDPSADVTPTPETPAQASGSYEDPRPEADIVPPAAEDTTPPASTDSETTPPATEGVE